MDARVHNEKAAVVVSQPSTAFTNKQDEVLPADFERAMDEAGFGLFNLFLLIIAIPATCATVFETTTMSYILPIAECDLQLTLFDKGILNAATYAGMITSAVIWGYLADTLGRKKILVYGFLADGVCVFCGSLSQSFEMLAVFKFLGGFIVNGPGAVLFTYLSELHTAKKRPRVLMVLGMVTTTATLILPLLALGIFPRDWDFVLFDQLNVHSWQIFLCVCSLPSLISGSLITLLPESPKFLMSQGRNSEALRAFQKIYAFNKRQPRHTYPIKQLIEEVPTRESTRHEAIYTIESRASRKSARPASRTLGVALRDGMQQIRPMFKKPLLGHSLHVYTMNFCILLGLNTIRLWLPQLFASIAEFEGLASEGAVDDHAPSTLCAILEYSANKTAHNALNYNGDCEGHKDVSIDMYIRNIIVALSGFVGYFTASFVVKAIGAKRMLTACLIISGCLGLGLYWSNSGLMTLVISACFVSIGSVATSSLLGVVVTLFPTALRTLVVAIAMMFGRLGALSGNLLFPVFVQIGCIPPFVMVGFVMLFAGALSLILPSTKKTIFT